jgi:hypothetical protein
MAAWRARAYAENPSEISRSSWLKSLTIRHPKSMRKLLVKVIGLCHVLVIYKARYQQEDI